MSEERKKILNMLAEGKISADDAERLLDALNKRESGDDGGEKIQPQHKGKLKCLKIQVEPKSGESKDKVNIKIPLQIIRAGIKLGSVIPDDAKNKINEALHEKGINLDVNELEGDSIDRVLESLAEMKINVDDDKDVVRIFCE
jgi:hypothetical protein